MIVLQTLAVIFIGSPFLPAFPNPHWFFRTADFIRLQSLGIEGVLLITFFFLNDLSTFDIFLIAGLVFSIIYQIEKVIPYTPLFKKKINTQSSDGMVSILAANVLQTNTNYKEFLELVKKYDADLVLTMETDKKWEIGLKAIEKKYTYSVKIPLDNFYGMHLYSKKKLAKMQVNYLVEKDVPSIFFEISISDNHSIFFVCMHPAPPSPTENKTAKERDAELMLVGKHIRKSNKPAVVCGDMNDVVWSRTTQLFKKMTAMIDPRVGRGFFSTYHAGYKFLRFPLDHIFHTKDLYIDKIERSDYFGSDHFAMYYEIFHKNETTANTQGTISKEEKEHINTKIEDAHK